MTDTEYRAAEGISHSQLVKLLENPEKFKYRLDNPQEPTPAMIFGQALHMAVLQPDIFKDNFVTAPATDRRTKAGKDAWQAFCSGNKNKIIITAEDSEIIWEMAEKINKCHAAKILLNGEHEKEIFWNDDMTGEKCKCRVDCISRIGGRNVITDIKTTVKAETETFMRSAINYGYHIQAAMYCEGVGKNLGDCDFAFIAIEKEPPYCINIMQADEYFIRHGKEEFCRLMNVYSRCRKSGNWYGYNGENNEINTLGLPLWLAKEVDFLNGY